MQYDIHHGVTPLRKVIVRLQSWLLRKSKHCLMLCDLAGSSILVSRTPGDWLWCWKPTGSERGKKQKDAIVHAMNTQLNIYGARIYGIVGTACSTKPLPKPLRISMFRWSKESGSPCEMEIVLWHQERRNSVKSYSEQIISIVIIFNLGDLSVLPFKVNVIYTVITP